MEFQAHLAGLGAESAVGTFVRVNGQLVKGNLIECGIDGHQRPAAQQSAGRTDELTEVGAALTDDIHHKQWKQNDEHQQDQIF